MVEDFLVAIEQPVTETVEEKAVVLVKESAEETRTAPAKDAKFEDL